MRQLSDSGIMLSMVSVPHAIGQAESDEIKSWKSEQTREQKIAGDCYCVKFKNRVQFLNDVGLEYLTLWLRTAASLSNGEAQRIQTGQSARQRSLRRAVCAGRTDHRVASARQYATDRCPQGSPRSGQYPDCGRTRSRGD